MNIYINYCLKYTIIITTFFCQLYMLEHHSVTMINPLLIAYGYTLLTSRSITSMALIALLLEIISFLQFGLIGLTLLFLVPWSWLLRRLESFFYYQIVLHVLLIVGYTLWISSVSFYLLDSVPTLFSIVTSMLANSIILELLYFNKQQ